MISRPAYPPNWEALARQCKERAGWKCEECGIEQYAIATSKRGKPYFIYLAACHVDHDKGNPQPALRCLCISCHSRFDYQRKQREARIRLEMIKHLRLLIAQGIVEVRYFL